MFLVVLELPGPEIRSLQEISSPELAGNRRKTRFRPKKGLYRVVVVLVVLVVVLVLLGVVLLVPVAVARCATFTYIKTTPRSTKTTTRTTQTNKNKTKNTTKTKQKHWLGRSLPRTRFPGVWRCARGGFRHAESEFEVENAKC